MKSILFVPAKTKMLDKIKLFESDSYIIDLEDSILPQEKEKSLYLVDEWLKNNTIKNLYVRLNSDNFQKEVEILKKHHIGFMLPKFDYIEKYIVCENIWIKHKIIALIETPQGILNAKKICECEWVDAIAFGAEDYTAKMNMANDNNLLIFQKSYLLNCARCFNKKIYDTPSFNIANIELLEKDILDSVKLGFDGKLAINPKQIQLINKLFSNYDIEYFKKIVDEYDKANLAILNYDGIYYEKMHIDRMRRIIKEHS